MKRSWKWAATAGGLVALFGAFVTGRSWADGIPATGALAYSGRLEASNGDPLTGTFNLELNFWNAASGGTSPLCTTNSQSVTLEQGRFSLGLPDECTDAVQANADVWIEILVDGSSLGRTKTGAVPYAVEASHATTADVAGSADTLGALAPGDVQERVTPGCTSANQSIKTINADGTVTCEADDNTTYTGSNGVTVSGSTISADTSYVQRRNAVLSTQCAGANQSIKTISDMGLVTCETDETYTPGSGISISGTTISISAVTAAHIADNAVGSLEIAVDAVRRDALHGGEIAVYRKHASCGGGLTDLTSCNTLPCNDDAPVSGGLWYLDCDGDCSAVASVTCTNPATRYGYMLDPNMSLQ